MRVKEEHVVRRVLDVDIPGKHAKTEVRKMCIRGILQRRG